MLAITIARGRQIRRRRRATWVGGSTLLLGVVVYASLAVGSSSAPSARVRLGYDGPTPSSQSYAVPTVGVSNASVDQKVTGPTSTPAVQPTTTTSKPRQ